MNLHCDCGLQHSHQIFSQDTLVWDDVPSNYIRLQKGQQFSRYGRNSHILKSYEQSLWPWAWRQQTNLFTPHSGFNDIILPSLVMKGMVIQKNQDIVWTNIQGNSELSLWPWPWTQTIQSFNKTHQLMIMYHPTKFGCKKKNEQFRRCTVMTMAHDDAPPYQILLQKRMCVSEDTSSWTHAHTDRQTSV